MQYFLAIRHAVLHIGELRYILYSTFGTGGQIRLIEEEINLNTNSVVWTTSLEQITTETWHLPWNPPTIAELWIVA